MNFKILTATLFLLSSLGLTAQSKLDGAASLLLTAGTSAAKHNIAPLSATEPERFTFIVTVLPGALDDAEDLDVEMISDEMAIVRTTPEGIAALAERDDVIYISSDRLVTPNLDKLRTSIHADEAHNASEGLETPYDGSGVIVGLMDVGLDPNHRAFLNDDGSNRATRLWYFSGTSPKEYAGEAIASFTTDNKAETHGTHVLGIITGSYDGESKYAKVSSSVFNPKVTIVNGNLPYVGVAPGAEPVIGCGNLYSSNIITALKKAVQYAESVGKPLVFNLSLGINTGPHDGTDSFSRSLAQVVGDAIVCVSGGNEGDIPLSLSKRFGEEPDTIRTFLESFQDSPIFSGTVDVWNSNDDPVDLSWVVYDTQEDEIVCELRSDGSDGATHMLGYYTTAEDKEFKKYFSGYVSVSQTINPFNDRTNVYCQATNVRPTTSNRDLRYRLGLTVTAAPGNKVNIYTESYSEMGFSNLNKNGWTKGDSSESINAMATGDNVIAVGSYTTKSTFGTLGGQAYRTGATLNQISSFSSWGTLPDGTTLPHIAAPGQMITAPVSSYYVTSTHSPDEMGAEVPGIAHATDWYHSLQGTSMAAPAVTGTIALWLQADPTLTREEILQIMSQTASTDSRTNAQPYRFGYGRINALEGLKYITSLGSLGSVSSDPEADLAILTGDGYLTATMLGSKGVSATLFNTSGITAATASSHDCDVTVPTAGLNAGVYILRVVSADGSTVSRKVVIR